jgi:hypothetical protein
MAARRGGDKTGRFAWTSTAWVRPPANWRGEQGWRATGIAARACALVPTMPARRRRDDHCNAPSPDFGNGTPEAEAPGVMPRDCGGRTCYPARAGKRRDTPARAGKDVIPHACGGRVSMGSSRPRPKPGRNLGSGTGRPKRRREKNHKTLN